ncbi:MAG: hypothetical protein WAW90_02690 [Minisyncoccia bacterium]
MKVGGINPTPIPHTKSLGGTAKRTPDVNALMRAKADGPPQKAHKTSVDETTDPTKGPNPDLGGNLNVEKIAGKKDVPSSLGKGGLINVSA